MTLARSLRAWIEVVRFLCAMRRWRAGTVPSRFHRRLLIQFLEGVGQRGRGGADILFGPALCQAVFDKARRRRMAVWKVKAMMTPVERMELAYRGLMRMAEKTAKRRSA